MKLLVYGGSFNPPHLGHVTAVKSAQQAVQPDLTLVIPAAIPPHKALEAGSPDALERLELSRRAFEKLPGVKVSDLELHRQGKSYTSDTVKELRAEYPEAEIFFLVGTDMLETFHQWHEFRFILSEVTLVATAREDAELEKVQAAADQLIADYGARIQVLTSEPLPLASTQLRRLLKRRCGAEYLPTAVYEHIIKERLYDARPSFDYLREQSYVFLKPKRVAHVWGCEHEARRLAERWGADVEFAAEAGILHDITKKFELSDQLLLSEKYGIINDNVELQNVKLLHAKTGAAMAKDLFGVPEEVENAIRWHTTGHENMTLLEQIIYMADYIEPTREFPGVEKLRALAYEDLRSAMILGLQMSLEEVRSWGSEPHPNTVKALSWFQTQQGEDA